MDGAGRDQIICAVKSEKSKIGSKFRRSLTIKTQFYLHMSVEILWDLGSSSLDALDHRRQDLGGLRTKLGLVGAVALARNSLVNLVAQHDEAVFLDLLVG